MHLHHLLPFLFTLLASAQDQCNLLPIQQVSWPLYSLISGTLNRTNQTLCERYTPPDTSQLQWVTRLINLAFTGDYEPIPNQWSKERNPDGVYQGTGLLDPMGVYRDPCKVETPVNLVPYFNGSLRSTNRNGTPTAINFLDGGSIPALRSNIASWNPASNQHKLLTHFYQYFGLLLGCRSTTFPAYAGNPSQTAIHRHMGLGGPELHYFIHNIYDAAVSIGVAGPDLVTHVGDAVSIGIALDNTFLKRCSPARALGGGKELQNVCSDPTSCSKWEFSGTDCAAYDQLSGYGVSPPEAPFGEADKNGGPCAASPTGGLYGNHTRRPR